MKNQPEKLSRHPITSPTEIVKLAKILSQSTILAVDTEFIREHTFFPEICLIQVSNGKDSWLIDCLSLNKTELAPFLEVMSDPKILKVLHASLADQECFWMEYEQIISPVFDTAIAASLCGLGDSIGLARLLNDVLNVELKKGHSRTNWAARPLRSELLEYAHQDVLFLVDLANVLTKRLERLDRIQWCLELSQSIGKDLKEDYTPEAYAVKIANRFAKGKSIDQVTYAAIYELFLWREYRAREVNIPRKRIVDDSVLFDLATVRPQDEKHLLTFRGLHSKEVRMHTDQILKSLRHVHHTKGAHIRDVPIVEVINKSEGHLLDFLQMFLKVIADEINISAKHIVNQEGLIKLIRTPPKSTKDLIEYNIISSGAVNLIGKHLLDFLHGKSAISLKDGEIAIVPITKK